MPTYLFRCEKCGETVEIRQRMTDERPTNHETCGGKLARIWTAPAIGFKGSGFYTTDSR